MTEWIEKKVGDKLANEGNKAETLYWWIINANSKEDAIDHLSRKLEEARQEALREAVERIEKLSHGGLTAGRDWIFKAEALAALTQLQASPDKVK